MGRAAPRAQAPEGAALLDPLLRRAAPLPRGGKRGTFRRLQAAIATRAAARGLLDRAAPVVVAVDATGFESHHVSQHFRIRRGTGQRRGQRQRAWPKLSVVLDVGSHLLLAARTQRGPTQDSPAFPALVRQACRLVPLDTVLADGAYDAERRHALAHERLGVREVIIPINPRNTGRRWPRTPYRRTVKRSWPRELKVVYGTRWHVESGFSRHKRRLGSALRARRPPAQRREMILRVLTHNFMLLARRRRRFSTEHAR